MWSVAVSIAEIAALYALTAVLPFVIWALPFLIQRFAVVLEPLYAYWNAL